MLILKIIAGSFLMFIVVGSILQMILPSKEKWNELKKQAENRRKNK